MVKRNPDKPWVIRLADSHDTICLAISRSERRNSASIRALGSHKSARDISFLLLVTYPSSYFGHKKTACTLYKRL